MKGTPIYRKVATDMFIVQMGWASGFLGVLLAIQVIKVAVTFFSDSHINHYFISSFVSSNIFMLVIGIIAGASFLSFYVQNGVSRKDFFTGAAIAGIALSICIPIISVIVTLIESGILKLFNLQIPFETPFSETDFEDAGNFLGNLIQSIAIPPFVDFSTNPMISTVIFFISLLTYYFIGWLISSAFIRFNWIIGLVVIVVSIVILFIQKWFIALGFELPATHMFATIELPFIISILAIVLMLAIVLFFIRQLTRKVVIKL